ncbi:MAG TPA: hypothetical protein VFT22_07175 [Kofleriaceae bacterium]|nr:hypothetical protein [Kofleriaceae bacterium]
MARAPFVAIRTDIRKEERILIIADIGGYNRHEAIGRLVDLWAWCTDRGIADAPEDCDGYAVSDAVVCRFLGPAGVQAILGNDCDEFALGERRPDGLIYLRGTSDTVSRLRALRNSASAGGIARATTKNVERKSGRFVGKKTKRPAGHQPATSDSPASDQPDTSQEPASTSEIPDPRSQIPDPDPDKRPASPGRAGRAPSGDLGRAIETFDTRFRQRYGRGCDWQPKQCSQLAGLVKRHGLEEVERRTGILFDHPPSFLRDSPPDVGTLLRFWDKLVVPSGSSRQPAARSPPSSQAVLHDLLADIADLERQEALKS